MADNREESSQLPAIDERQLELFEQFVAIQKEELDLRAKQLVIRDKEIVVEDANLQRGHEYALKALDAVGADNKARRETHRYYFALIFGLSCGLVLLLTAFCAYALYLNKIELVKDIMLQIFGTGGIGAADH